jgi:cell division protein ZipA
MNDIVLLRIIIGFAALVLIAAIYFLGKPRKPDQGRRTDGRTSAAASASGKASGDRGSSDRGSSGRSEPTLGEILEKGARDKRDGVGDADEQARLDQLERSLGGDAGTPESPRQGPLRPSLITEAPRRPKPSQPTLGIRPDEKFDQIVTLYVAARAGHLLNGSDLVVAAEKAGLVHGDMGIYHRLVDGRPEVGPVFSVANMVKPGNFDLTRVQEMRTPGISFFMTLPAPLLALDAWDAMLPTAQRMAELLDALVLDEERNALGRQRIAHIRDEMRAYDRKREQQLIRPTR